MSWIANNIITRSAKRYGGVFIVSRTALIGSGIIIMLGLVGLTVAYWYTRDLAFVILFLQLVLIIGQLELSLRIREEK